MVTAASVRFAFIFFMPMFECSPSNLRGDTKRSNVTEFMSSFALLAETFQREYSSDQYLASYKTYEANLQLIAMHNAAEIAAGGSAIFSLNHLFDRQMHFKVDMSPNLSVETFYEVSQYLGAKTAVDWRGVYTTPVKDEINCWSCWAFPATQQVESDSIRTLGFTTNDVLSAQQLISCTNTNSGCADGSIQNAYNYIKSAGLERESSYPLQSPLTGNAGACGASSQNFIVSIFSFHYIRRGDEQQIANYVLSTGTYL